MIELGIHRAFAGVVLGRGTSIRQTEVIDLYGEGCTLEEFNALPREEETDNWASITDDELERIQVAHLDPEGYRYYIPALALSVLRNCDQGSMRVIGTLLSLCPSDPHSVYTQQRHRLLSNQQMASLAAYMNGLPNLVKLHQQDSLNVQAACRTYWFKFLVAANDE